MNEAELVNRLEMAPPMVMLDSKQQSEVDDVLKHPGISHIYGLMLGSRQALYATLARMPLGNAAEVTRAAVLQGKISGIEHFGDTLLSLTVPEKTQTTEQNNG